MADRICSVEGCSDPVRYQRSMCARHLRLWWKYGSTEDRIPPPRATCSAPGCVRDSIAKGLCGAHYARQRKGVPMDTPVRDDSDPELVRFWRRVDRRGERECWPWVGPCDANGYGVFSHKGKIHKAHRYSLGLTLGSPVPHGLGALHSCDNPPCVNPAHLRAGSQAENMADMARRGRSARQRGEASARARLTTADVIAIRAAVDAGRSYADVGREYGVHPSHIKAIWTRQRWGHV